MVESAQSTLPWPGTDQPCRKCEGAGNVYYLHASRPGVVIIGGKRIVCPTCGGTGKVRGPASAPDAA